METKPLVLLVGVYDSKADADTHYEPGTGCGALATVLWPRRPGPVVLHAGTSHYVVTATVDSARIGGTAIEIDHTTRAGGPLDRAIVQIEAVMPLMGHATPPVPEYSSGGGY
jgi:hypothetical protein